MATPDFVTSMLRAVDLDRAPRRVDSVATRRNMPCAGRKQSSLMTTVCVCVCVYKGEQRTVMLARVYHGSENR